MRSSLSLRRVTFCGLLTAAALVRSDVPAAWAAPPAGVLLPAYGPRSCTELLARNRAAFNAGLRARPRLRAEFQGTTPLADPLLRSFDQLLGRCLPQKNGFIGLAVRPGAVKGCAGDCDDVTWRLSVRLSLVSLADGRVNEADRLTATARGAMPPRELGFSTESAPQLDSWVDLLGAYDYDGDGHPEVLLALGEAESGEGTRIEHHLLTLGPRGLRAYPHSPPLGEDGRMEDVDGDGRPDLVTRGAYAAATITTCGTGDDAPAVAPMFVHHALPDGRFSDSDAVARAALVRACPEPQPVSLASLRRRLNRSRDRGQDLETALARAVVCARAYAPAATVLAQLQADCRRWVEGAWYGDFIGCGEGVTDPKACPMWIKRLVAIEPTLHLR